MPMHKYHLQQNDDVKKIMYEYHLKFGSLPLFHQQKKPLPSKFKHFFSANRHKMLSLIKLHISSRIWDFRSHRRRVAEEARAVKKYRNQHQTLFYLTNLCLKKINLLELRFNKIFLEMRNGEKKRFQICQEKNFIRNIAETMIN
jgi:hypothetical protein